MRSKRRLLYLLLAFALIGVGMWWSGGVPGLRDTQERNVSGPPSIIGRIEVGNAIPGTFMIVPGEKTARDAVIIQIRPDAKVSRKDGKPVVFRTGQIVSVWCSGPMEESKPPRLGADMVVIESDGE